MANLTQRLKIRASYEVKKLFLKPFRHIRSPFQSKNDIPAIIHCCYHKIGTLWFHRILRDIAAEYGLSFQYGSNYTKIQNFEQYRDSDIFLDQGSHVQLDKIPSYVCSHMIRDPRDMIVSGYFYHLWTNETWANLPRVEYRGMSYKEYLNSIDQDQGLLKEIRRVWYWVPHMVNWDYNNPRSYEIKYEDIISDEETIFRQMFEHYGFKPSAVDRCCQIASKYSFKRLKKNITNQKKSKSHLRSGRSGEWRELFKEKHKKLFKELYPESLKALGYERDDRW